MRAGANIPTAAMAGKVACTLEKAPLQHLSLHLETHQQEEDRHEAIVDPEQQRLVDVERRDANLYLGIEEA